MQIRRYAYPGWSGVGKTELMEQATGKAKDVILPWVEFSVTDAPASEQVEACLRRAQANGITLPFACKPDIGCRGVGVKLVETAEELAEIISVYPDGAILLCQKLASYEPEVGCFLCA